MSGFWQIPLHEDFKHATAFATPFDQYEFNVLPFGLVAAPAAFKRAMTNTLNDFIGTFCHVYLDHILMYSKSAEEHQKHVKMVLDRLKSLNFKPNKMHF